MAITNLTNTSWYFNETLDACGIGDRGIHIGALESEWYIDINWYDVHFNTLYYELGYTNNLSFETIGEDGESIPEQRFGASQYEGGGWRHEAFRTITITGGADVENPDLITWITSNATQVEDPHPTHDTDKHCLIFSSPTDFTLEAIENGSDHAGMDPEMGGVEPWITNRGYWDGILLYSTDGIYWSEWADMSTCEASYALSSVNGKLYLRGIGNTQFSVEEILSDKIDRASCSYYWQINGEQVSCDGNIETLLDCGKVANGEHPEAADCCFMRLFNGWWGELGCPALISAPDILMETIPSMGCYHTFDACTNLVKAPRITATNLGDEALGGMFEGCTSLNQLPELLTTDLPLAAYRNMFIGCSNIKLSEEQTEEYKYEYRIPSSGIGTAYTEDEWSDSLGGMFADTGGTFTDTPELNTVYYTSNEIVRAFPSVEEEPTGSTCTFDLSTLGLPAGEYTIYVKLSAEGYKDSEPSNEVIYEVAGETLMLKYPRIAMEANTMQVYEPSTEVDKVAVYVDGELVDTVDTMITVSITNVGPGNLAHAHNMEGIALTDSITREIVDLSDIDEGETRTIQVHTNSEFWPYRTIVTSISGDSTYVRTGFDDYCQCYVLHSDCAIEIDPDDIMAGFGGGWE